MKKTEKQYIDNITALDHTLKGKINMLNTNCFIQRPNFRKLLSIDNSLDQTRKTSIKIIKLCTFFPRKHHRNEK